MDGITSTQTHHQLFSSSLQHRVLFENAIFPCQTRFNLCKCNSIPCSQLSQKQSHHPSFDEIPVWDTFAWNNLIQTHLTNGHPAQVTATYGRMLSLGVRPDRRTLPRVLAASRLSGNFPLGKQLHCHAIKLGFSSDAYVMSSLIEFYGQLEGIQAAQRYYRTANFDNKSKNAVAWTLLAAMFVKYNKPELAIDLFNEIISSDEKVSVDPVALATVITACGMLKSLRDGRRVHQIIAEDFGLECDVLVGNSLVKMYIDCGSLEDARAVFDKLTCKDVISWTSMIYGYVNKGEFNEGLKLFRLMNENGIKADAFAVSSVLPACARVAAHKNGKEIHGYLLRNGIELNVAVLNALVDMYVKSGWIDYASRIFAGMKQRDVISLTVMILGYSLHGKGKLGVELYQEMVGNSRIQVDQTTLAAVLYACFSACLVEEGWHYFNRFASPKVSNCSLMVGILACAGLFDEAKALIVERKISRHGEVLRALLGGCRIQKNLSEGKKVIEQLLELEPLNAENYVMLANWYAQHEKWDMVAKTRDMIADMGLRPRKAYSWIELKNKVHVFGTGDRSHPRSETVYSELERLLKRSEAKGFQMSSDFSLHGVDEERGCDPSGHSELLAISYGLISAAGAQQTIRVTKNLGMCGNCHSLVKAISEEVGRGIVVRDPSCFHHFKGGFCSCGDCW